WSVVVVQLVPFLVDNGHSINFAAFAAGIVGIGQLPGRLVFFFLGRSLRLVWLLMSSFGLSVVALALLTFTQSEVSVLTFAVVFGVSAGMLTLMSASMPAELFGRRVYGTLSGVIYACANIARAVAPLASALIALLPGGYTTLLDSLIVLSI